MIFLSFSSSDMKIEGVQTTVSISMIFNGGVYLLINTFFFVLPRPRYPCYFIAHLVGLFAC